MIPVPVKQFVLEYLDYDSRCNLKLTSKDNKALVDSIKYVAKLVSIGEQKTRSIIFHRFESKLLELREEIDGVTEVFLRDLEKNEEPKKVKEFQKSRYDVAKNWVDKISHRGKTEAKTIRILNLSMEPSENWIIKCETLETRMIGSKNLRLWLQKAIPNLKKLDITDWGISGIFDMPQVKNTSEVVRLSRDVEITDEQLEKIKAPSLIVFSADGTLTEAGAREAFKKYLENSQYGDRFELKFSIPPSFNHMDLFDKNWVVRKTGPNDDTEGEYHYTITGGFNNINGVTVIPTVIIFDFSSYMTLKAFHFQSEIRSPLFY
ncbi:hypothetical protein CAEBREN_02839 [Caenorhabditis brenneri]|uniref:F-box domain-containing protein n=1 Tax=Caenorhabditis brenneri TaxID=135651 RepID=G0NMJ5_CAEBE|nr:hypothetical protein CAEBREN_02839 [Caenorhabditis brenneri]